MSDLHDKARGLATYLAVCDGDKTSAGIVRDLLAENERLTQVAAEHRDGRLAALERAAAAESAAIAAELAHLKRVRSAIVIPADSAHADDLILTPRPSMEKN